MVGCLLVASSSKYAENKTCTYLSDNKAPVKPTAISHSLQC